MTEIDYTVLHKPPSNQTCYIASSGLSTWLSSSIIGIPHVPYCYNVYNTAAEMMYLKAKQKSALSPLFGKRARLTLYPVRHCGISR
jgi:hypothetical protein